MKRLPPMMVLVTGLAVAAAHAQAPAPQEPATPPAAIEQDAAAPTAEPAAAPAARDAAGKRLSDANCLRETGSRIAQRDGKPRCTGQPGRVYTKDDIDRTGHTNLSEALRTLDPAIQ